MESERNIDEGFSFSFFRIPDVIKTSLKKSMDSLRPNYRTVSQKSDRNSRRLVSDLLILQAHTTYNETHTALWNNTFQQKCNRLCNYIVKKIKNKKLDTVVLLLHCLTINKSIKNKKTMPYRNLFANDRTA